MKDLRTSSYTGKIYQLQEKYNYYKLILFIERNIQNLCFYLIFKSFQLKPFSKIFPVCKIRQGKSPYFKGLGPGLSRISLWRHLTNETLTSKGGKVLTLSGSLKYPLFSLIYFIPWSDLVVIFNSSSVIRVIYPSLSFRNNAIYLAREDTALRLIVASPFPLSYEDILRRIRYHQILRHRFPPRDLEKNLTPEVEGKRLLAVRLGLRKN